MIGVAQDAVVVPNDGLIAVGAEAGDGLHRLVETVGAGLSGGGLEALGEAEDAIWGSAGGGVGVGGEVEGGAGCHGGEEGVPKVGLELGVGGVVAGVVVASCEDGVCGHEGCMRK